MTRVAWFVVCSSVLMVAIAARPAAAPQTDATAAQRAPAQNAARALLDKYCVTCHNDRVKTANLSLQNADLTAIPAHAELWEKVIRKLRAGVMPPPDMPRP